MRVTESTVEATALEWLEGVGWQVAHGPDIAPHADGTERADYSDVILKHRLRDALDRLNPDLPGEALDDAFRKVSRPQLDFTTCSGVRGRPSPVSVFGAFFRVLWSLADCQSGRWWLRGCSPLSCVSSVVVGAP